jgi:hypothetical protein
LERAGIHGLVGSSRLRVDDSRGQGGASMSRSLGALDDFLVGGAVRARNTQLARPDRGGVYHGVAPGPAPILPLL